MSSACRWLASNPRASAYVSGLSRSRVAYQEAYARDLSLATRSGREGDVNCPLRNGFYERKAELA